MTLRVNAGCGNHYARGWVNVDLVRNDAAGICPDIIGSLQDLPFGDGSVARLYAGHVAEHLSLQDGPPSTFDAAMREVARVLAPDGVACFVCPDVKKALAWWKDGRADWALVDACLEGPDDGVDPADAHDGTFHAWNCNADRMLAQIARTFPGAVAVPMNSLALDEFPVVSRADWQSAVMVAP